MTAGSWPSTWRSASPTRPGPGGTTMCTSTCRLTRGAGGRAGRRLSRVADPSRWALKLDRPDLVRAGAYIDGAWLEERSELSGARPGDRRDPGRGAGRRAALARQATEAAARALPGLAGYAGQGPRPADPRLVRHGDAQRRRHGSADLVRAGQAGGRGQGRGRLCRRLSRLVLRTGLAGLRRDHPVAAGRPPHADRARAGGGGGRDPRRGTSRSP